MKRVLMTIALLSLSYQASASDLASVSVLQNAKIVEVNCEPPTNLNHDLAYAGTVVVEGEEGNRLVMEMIFNRLVDAPRVDAKVFCSQLKKVKKAGERVDVLMSYREEFDGASLVVKTQIHGALKVFGIGFVGG